MININHILLLSKRNTKKKVSKETSKFCKVNIPALSKCRAVSNSSANCVGRPRKWFVHPAPPLRDIYTANNTRAQRKDIHAL